MRLNAGTSSKVDALFVAGARAPRARLIEGKRTDAKETGRTICSRAEKMLAVVSASACGDFLPAASDARPWTDECSDILGGLAVRSGR